MLFHSTLSPMVILCRPIETSRHGALNGAAAPPLARHSSTSVQHTTAAHRSTTARTGVLSSPPTLAHMSAPAGAAAATHGGDSASRDLNGQCKQMHSSRTVPSSTVTVLALNHVAVIYVRCAADFCQAEAGGTTVE